MTKFLKFLIVGTFAAGINFSSRILFNFIFDYTTSIILAFIIGLITAFCLFKIFVFKTSHNSIKKSACYFVFINLLALFQTLIISLILNNYLLPEIGIDKFRPEIAHFVGISVPLITSFLGHKYLTFANEKYI